MLGGCQMIAQLTADEEVAPYLFHWSGRVLPSELRNWIRTVGIMPPSDLVWLWIETGGGTMFETEEVLCPMKSAINDLDVLTATKLWHGRGLDPQLLVFHQGMCVSAWDHSAGKVRTYSRRDLRALEDARSIDEWYTQIIRAEYAARYGLTP